MYSRFLGENELITISLYCVKDNVIVFSNAS